VRKLKELDWRKLEKEQGQQQHLKTQQNDDEQQQ
jgi:hypothetical protein